jgi:gluconokinase
VIIVLMGVSGSGKTTVGKPLSEALGWEFLDADDFHPPANKEKMARGIPLTDADRGPWLDALGEALRDRAGAGRDVVLACSALKQAYRDRLSAAPGVRFVYLKGDTATLRQRLETRHGHFFRPELLESQLEALEEPKNALTIEISDDPGSIVRRIEQEFGLR